MKSIDTSGANSEGTLSSQEILISRLREVGVPTDRAVDLPEGSKRNNYDHTDPQNRLDLTEVSGSYGILCGDGLLVVDLDSYHPEFDRVLGWVEGLPKTLTIRTPHDGEHRYFAVDGSPRGTREPGVDVIGKNQYVVGPGTILTDCENDGHDCSLEGEGQYAILHDLHIAQIQLTDIQDLRASKGTQSPQSASKSSQLHGQAITTDTGDTVMALKITVGQFERDYDPMTVLERLLFYCKHARRNRALVFGRYADAGYPGDRSRAESALVEEIGFWFDDDREIIWALMDAICQQVPGTDTGKPRKWLERGDRYRNSLFGDWFRNRDCGTFTPHLRRQPWDPRPEVSDVTVRKVYNAIRDLQVATTKEIVDHQEVDRSERQVQRSSKKLIEAGIIDSERKGVYRYYYPSGREDLLRARVGS